MGTDSALTTFAMLRKLPPAGNRSPTSYWDRSEADEYLRRELTPYRVTFLNSGTAALALAVVLAKHRAGEARNEVVMPAYACPDLVSAVLCAGCYPRLADVEPERWQYRRAALERSVSAKTLAVLAVDLLGLGDDCDAARAAAQAVGAVLIQDSAQSIQAPAERCWEADYVVLSFNRGKPVNLLGGGALLLKRREDEARLAELVRGHPVVRQRLENVKALAFNKLTHPRTYWALSALPLGVGRTQYQAFAFSKIATVDLARRLAPAWHRYVEGPRDARATLDGYFDRAAGIGTRRLSGSPERAESARLLRYPILAPDREARARIIRTLNHLGASPLYERPLPGISAIPDPVREQGLFPGAEALADRLVTLPLHDRTSKQDAALMCELLEGLAS